MPVEHAEPGDPRALLGVLEQQLEADADAEHRFAHGDGVEDHPVEPARPQRRRAGAEVADARQHDPDRPVRLGGRRDETGLGADVRQRLLGRAQVADPVVEHGDHGLEDPLRGGHARRPRRASRRGAPGRRALNDASRTWWVFLPWRRGDVQRERPRQ